MLGLLASACSGLGADRLAANASRCPEMVREEIERHSGRDCLLLFEERPLGVCGTLARLARITGGGDWLVCNTDAVTGLDFGDVLRHHRERRADWTAVFGRMPEKGTYHGVGVSSRGSFPASSGSPRHYWGYSILGPAVIARASGAEGSGFFTGLAVSCSEAGLGMSAFETEGEWFDTGETELYRANLLSRPPVVREHALIEPGAVLEGGWYVGRGCRVASGAVVRDSVMLDGSALLGGVLEREVLPWMEHRGPA